VVQGELLDIKRELEEQQKINSLLRREVHKLQSRTTSGMG
jgi:cell division protein FtsL